MFIWVAWMVKTLPAVQETWVQSLESRSSPGEGHVYPLQYLCLGNPVDRGAYGLQSVGQQRVRDG